MMKRAGRVVLAFGLIASLEAPVLAQVRPITMPGVALTPGAPAAAVVNGTAFGVAPAALLSAPALSAAPSLAAAPMSAPAAFAAPAAVAPALAAAPAASLPAAQTAKAALTALTAAPVPGAPALSGYESGRLAFDGAALSGPAADPAPAAPVAPRGDTLSFNGQSLPTRMFSDKTQVSAHLIRAIDATKKTLDIAIYELAIREVHDALKRAKDRGVKIRIVMDEGHVYPTKPGARRTPEVQAMIDDGFAI
ncbi:MAG: hypothetical protein HY079_15140, partial [Elusimicrobia bacterium]|nr:hypothetical protein [Elusimicrobiota bacterium]